MAATSFALESVLELSSRLADAGETDIRIEAALAKLYASEHAWRVGDDLVQIRGGRGYETADSLRARGERGIPVEQILRDLRINRIFEGSTEIMHLLIAREAVDTHLAVAGDIIDPDADRRAKIEAAGRAARFYAGWLPTLAVGPGHRPGCVRRVRPARRPPPVRRAHQPTAGPLDVLRHGAVAGHAWSADRPTSPVWSTSARSCSRSPRPASAPTTCTERGGPEAATAVDLADAFCQPVATAGRDDVHRAAAQHRPRRRPAGPTGRRRRLRLAGVRPGRRHRRPARGSRRPPAEPNRRRTCTATRWPDRRRPRLGGCPGEGGGRRDAAARRPDRHRAVRGSSGRRDRCHARWAGPDAHRVHVARSPAV